MNPTIASVERELLIRVHDAFPEDSLLRHFLKDGLRGLTLDEHRCLLEAWSKVDVQVGSVLLDSGIVEQVFVIVYNGTEYDMFNPLHRECFFNDLVLDELSDKRP
jgi:hypothetical protein